MSLLNIPLFIQFIYSSCLVTTVTLKMDIQQLEINKLVNMYINALCTVKNRIKICDSHNGISKERDMSW